jgi:putative Holliday junction resolvase
MRGMGLDVGSKTIGVAVSDSLGWTAQGLETISRVSLKADLKRLKTLATGYEVDRIVIGLPKNMSGSLGEQAIKVQGMAREVERELGLPVILWDERLSTVAAEKVLLEGDMSRKKRRRVIDKLAAVIILQSYLDSLSRPGQV